MASETFKRWRDPHVHPKPTAVHALVAALAWMAAERIEAARMARRSSGHEAHDDASAPGSFVHNDYSHIIKVAELSGIEGKHG